MRMNSTSSKAMRGHNVEEKKVEIRKDMENTEER
jgi:hypothetical protein